MAFSLPVAGRRAVWPFMVGLVLGCGTEPDEERIHGAYALTAVDGSALPYLVPDSDPDCDVSIYHGDLVLSAPARYYLEFQGPYDCAGGQTGELGRFYKGNYDRTGNSITFSAAISGYGTLEFQGTVENAAIEVTVPPIPPATGPDLTLDFTLFPD
jgi:hypothetical protein